MKIIQAGGVELHDKRNRVVNRRRPREPTLEVSKFVPFFNENHLDLRDLAKVLAQTVLEDLFQKNFKAIEIDDGNNSIICEFLSSAIRQIPLVVSEVIFLTKKEDLNFENVEIAAEDIENYSNIDMIIKSNCIKDEEFLINIKKVISENGFLVSKENLKNFNENDLENIENFEIVSKLRTEDQIFILMRVKNSNIKFITENSVEISQNVENWLENLKMALNEENVIIYSYNQEVSGILGELRMINKKFKIFRGDSLGLLD
jgi:fatty acid synthase